MADTLTPAEKSALEGIGDDAPPPSPSFSILPLPDAVKPIAATAGLTAPPSQPPAPDLLGQRVKPQFSVFGSALPGTDAARQGQTAHPLTVQAMQSFDILDDVDGGRAAKEKAISEATGMDRSVVRDIHPAMLDRLLKRQDVQYNLDRAVHTRRTMTSNLEMAAVLKDEIPIMLASERTITRMQTMMREAAEAAEPPDAIANIGRGFVRGNRRISGMIAFAGAYIDLYQAKLDEAGLETKEQSILDVIISPTKGRGKDLQVLAKALSVLGVGTEENREENLKSALAGLEEAQRHLQLAEKIPLGGRALRFVESAKDTGWGGYLTAIKNDPAGFAEFIASVSAEQTTVLAASASAAVLNPALGAGVMLSSAFSQEAFALERERAKIIKDEFDIDLMTPKGREQFLKSPEAQSRLLEFGLTRGSIITAVEGASFGLLRPISRLQISNLSKYGAMTATQMLAGGAGEAAALKATGQRLDAFEILTEAFAEASPVNVAIEASIATAGDVKNRRDAKRVEAWLKGQTELKGNIAGIPEEKLTSAASVMADQLREDGVESVYLSADELMRFDQDGDLTATLGLDTEAVREAAVEGNDVEIDVSTYIRHILGKDGFDALLQHTKFDIEGMTGKQAEEFVASGISEQIEEQLQRRAEQRLAPRVGDADLKKIADDAISIRDQVSQQLVNTGRYNAQRADMLGQLQAQRFITRAVRMTEETGQPVDALALFEADNLRIEGEGVVAPALEQIQIAERELAKTFKDVRIPALEEAARQRENREITQEEYNAKVEELKSVRPYKEEDLPSPTSTEAMEGALKENQKGRIGKGIGWIGELVGLRLDIPAYTNHNVWVPTIHDPKGKPVAHDAAARITGVTFTRPGDTAERKAARVGKGETTKSPFAQMNGTLQSVDPQELQAMQAEAINDPAWTQVGYDPRRHTFFYDRATQQPVLSADEVIQVGPLVLAKNVQYGDAEAFLFQDADLSTSLEGLYDPVSKAISELPLPEWKVVFTPRLTPELAEERAALQQRMMEFVEETEPDFKQTGAGTPRILEFASTPEGERLNELSTLMRQDDYGTTKREAEEKARASGQAIWAKISKTDIGPGNNRKDALKFSGLEEFLLTEPDRTFSKSEVLQFLRKRGVNLVEIVADVTGVDEQDFGSILESFDENVMDMGDYRARETIDNSMVDIQEEYNSEEEYTRQEIYEVIEEQKIGDITADEVDIEYVFEKGPRPTAENQQLDLFEDAETSLERQQETWDAGRSKELDEQVFTEINVEEAAQFIAEARYADDPYITSEVLLDNDSYEIWGNDDIGYYGENNNFLDAYSLAEAQIQVMEELRDQDRLHSIDPDRDTSEIAKWESYIVDGESENYRERKWTLPDIEKDFYNDTHFQDRNIVAFTRETTRKLFGDNSKVYAIEELQSDWHQLGRKLGYATGEVSAGILEQNTIRSLDAAALSLEEVSEEVVGGLKELLREHLVEPDLPAGGSLYQPQEATKEIAIIVSQVLAAAANDISDAAFATSKTAFFNDLNAYLNAPDHKIELKEFVNNIEEAAADLKQYRAELYGAPAAPFSEDGWIALALKRALVEAVRDGYSHFSWANSYALQQRWGKRSEELYTTQYDKKMPSITKKLTGQTPILVSAESRPPGLTIDNTFGWKVKKQPDGKFAVVTDRGSVIDTFDNREDADKTLDGFAPNEEAFWTIEITDELREQVNGPGFSLFQETPGKDDAPRGGFTPSDLITDQDGNSVNLIQIFEKANSSTFLHESGHFWLEQLKADAAAVSGQFQKDFDIVTKWWGSRSLEIKEEAIRRAKKKKDKAAVAALQKMTDAQVKAYIGQGDLRGEGATRWLSIAMHEQFARGVESYFATGNAPSLGLADLFAQFAAWIQSVYRRFTGTDVQMSDEVRGVMDRLLATDEEIAVAQGQYELASLFETAEEAGMTPKQFAALQRKIQQGVTASKAQQMAKKMAEEQRARTKWWNEERETLREQATDEVKQQDAYRLLWVLSTGGMADGSQAATHERLGQIDRKLLAPYLEARELTFKNLPKAGRASITATGKDLVDPGTAAAAFGFADADAMVDALVALPPFEAAVEADIDRRMAQEHGSMDLQGQEEAVASVHGDHVAKGLAAELEALRTTEPAFKLQFVRAYARNKLNRMPVGDVKAFKFLTAEKRSARMARAALKKGDKAEAYRHQFQRLVNHYLAREAIKAERTLQKQRRALKDYQNPKKKFPGVDAKYVDKIKEIVAVIDFEAPTSDPLRALAELQAIQEFILEAQEVDGAVIELPQWLQDKDALENMRDMTYGRFVETYEMMRALEKQGRLAKKLRLGKELRNRQEVISEMRAKLAGRDTSRVNKLRSTFISPGGGVEFQPALHSTLAALTEVDGSLLKIEMLLEAIDGEPLGPWQQTIYQPFADSYNRSLEMMADVSKMIEERMAAMPKDVRKSLGERVDVGDFGPPDSKWRRENLLMLALNVGNEGNLEKLVEGYKEQGWNISEDLVGDVLDQLTKEEWDFVQSIWDHADKLWPSVEAVFRAENGVSPPRVEARTVTTLYGDYRGGYFPMLYDYSYASGAAAARNEQRNALEVMQSGAGRASVNSSMTKGRTGYSAPVSLDINRLTEGFNTAIHYITHYDAVRNVRKIMGDEELRSDLERTVGKAYAREIDNWVAALAANNGDATPLTRIEKTIAAATRNTTVAALGFSYTTLAAQTFGLTTAYDRLLQDAGYGPVNAAKMAKFLASGLKQSINPAKREAAFAASAELRHRFENVDRDLRSTILKLRGKDGKFNKALEFSMTSIAAMQVYTVDVPTWIAAYNYALSVDPSDDARAVNYADRVVRMSQSSGAPKDLATIQRRQGLVRLGTMFYTYFSALYGILRGVGVEFSDNVRRNPVRASMKAATRVFIVVTLQETASALIRGKLPDWEPEDEDEEGMAKFLLKATLTGATATIPFARDIVSGIYSDYGYSGSPVAMFGENVRKAAGEVDDLLDEDEEEAVKAADFLKPFIVVAGVLTGKIPSIQTNRFLDGLQALWDEEDEWSYEDLLRGYDPDIAAKRD